MSDIKVVVRFTAPIQPNRFNKGEGDIAAGVAAVIKRVFGGFVNHSDVVEDPEDIHWRRDQVMKVREAYVLMYVPESIKLYQDAVGKVGLMDALDFSHLTRHNEVEIIDIELYERKNTW